MQAGNLPAYLSCVHFVNGTAWREMQGIARLGRVLDHGAARANVGRLVVCLSVLCSRFGKCGI